MNLVAIAIACVVLFVGAYVGKKDLSRYAQNSNARLEEKHEVLSTEDEQNTTHEDGTSYDVTTAPKNFTNDLTSYLYVDADIVSQTDTKLSLSSSANVDIITAWYEDKIKSEGMNIKTFVTTNANDKILNKLVGANANKEISVEISKEPGETNCFIHVTVIPKSQAS